MHDPESVEALFERFARHGDTSALGAAYDRLAPALLAVALHVARDSAEAEDLLQATFVTAIERAAHWQRDTRVEPWLAGILAHHARNASRARARVPDAERLHVTSPTSPLDEARARELDEELTRGLAQVPEDWRPVLVLRVRHGLTAAEIAAALGRPPGTVRTQLSRALEIVRRVLPAGLASSFVALAARPARGLDLVRAAVVEHATQWTSVSVASTGAASIAGALLMKKLVGSLVALAVLAAGVWFLTRDIGHPDVSQLATAPGDERAQAPQLERASADARAPLPRAAAESDASSRAVEAASTPASTRVENRLTVRVRFASRAEPAADVIVIVARSLGSSYPLDSLELTTDASGLATIADQPAGPIFVRTALGGTAHGLLPQRGTLALELELARGIDVDGRVVDVHGAPLADARVWLSESSDWRAGHVVATTREDGRFRLRDVRESCFLAAKARQHALSYLQRVVGAAGARVSLTILLDRDGAELRGRVIDLDGASIGNALVLAGSEDPRPTRVLENGLSALESAPQSARSSADGSFSFDGLALGACRIQARARGFAPAAIDVEVDVPQRESRPFEVRLAPAARIVGRAFDEDGAALPSVEVRVGEPGFFASGVAFSDSSGRFELEGLAPGEVLVRASSRTARSLERRFTLRAGETREWDVRFSAAGAPHAIRGVVVDEHGAALAGMGVSAMSFLGREVDSTAGMPTDEQGRFALLVNTERAYRVLVHGPDEWTVFPRALVDGVHAGDEPLRIVVEDAARTRARIVGSIVDPRGKPVADAQILVNHETLPMLREARPSGADGRFEIPLVPPGRVTLDVRTNTHPWLKTGAHELSAGETLDLGLLQLADSGSVHGAITGIADAALATLEITINEPKAGWNGTATIVEHEYRSSALAPGKYQLYARGDGVLDQQLDFEIAVDRETRLDLHLQPASTRRVICTLPATGPHPEWLTFIVVSSDQRCQSVRSVRGGEQASVEACMSLTPGSHTLRVLTPTGHLPDLTFTHSATTTDPIQVTLTDLQPN